MRKVTPLLGLIALIEDPVSSGLHGCLMHTADEEL